MKQKTIAVKILPKTSKGKTLIVAETDEEEYFRKFDEECWEKYDDDFDWSELEKKYGIPPTN